MGLLGCGTEPGPPSARPSIELSGIRAYRHAGDRLVATVKADHARIDPETRQTVLDHAVLRLPARQMTLSAPVVQFDPEAHVARGEGGITAVGRAWTLTGRRFRLSLRDHGLEIDDAVHARGEAVP